MECNKTFQIINPFPGNTETIIIQYIFVY